MATAQDVLRIAAAEIGYCRWDDKQAGTRYGRWYAQKTGSSYFGQNGVAFCAMFVSWCLDQAGASCAGFPTASCSAAYNGAKPKGAVLSDKRGAKPGDVLIFDWDNTGWSWDHTGFCEINRGSSVQTIEGNTTGPDGRSGSVARKVRSWDDVYCVIRPSYSAQQTSNLPTKLAEDGKWGEATTLRAQELAGMKYKDGKVSRQNADWKGISKGCTTGWEWLESGYKDGSPLIGYLQELWGAKVDKLCGPDTWDHFIGYYKPVSGATKLDSKVDYPSKSVKALQHQMNLGKLTV